MRNRKLNVERIASLLRSLTLLLAWFISFLATHFWCFLAEKLKKLFLFLTLLLTLPDIMQVSSESLWSDAIRNKWKFDWKLKFMFIIASLYGHSCIAELFSNFFRIRMKRASGMTCCAKREYFPQSQRKRKSPKTRSWACLRRQSNKSKVKSVSEWFM